MKDGKERVERARTQLLEDEASVGAVESELRELDKNIEAHRAETARREREARAPRVEEVASDMDVEDGCGSEGEVGTNVEAGKKRKVVRKGRVSTSACLKGMDLEEIIQALQQMPESERERCITAVKRPDFGVGVSCTVSEVSEFGGVATAPTQRTWGRWRRPGESVDTNEFFGCSGV